MKKTVWRIVKEYSLILLGSLIYAVAFDWLFVPNNIVMGGLTGISQILQHFIPSIPIGTAVIVMNIPLFALGFKLQGIHLLLSSLFAMATSSVFIDVIPLFIEFNPMGDQFMSSVLGGALLGLSMGIQLWQGATTGGTELGARLLKYKFRHIPIGKLCLFIDLAVIILYTATCGELKDGLYAGIAMYVSSIAMDTLIYGRRVAKVACIICDDGEKKEKMKSELLEMDMGVTSIRAEGGYSGVGKNVLICAFKPSKISALKIAVTKIDPNAFVIVCEAQDVFGEGFAQCEVDSL